MPEMNKDLRRNIPRPASTKVLPPQPVNPVRAAAQASRQEARQQSASSQSGVRPLVRPAAPPLKVMAPNHPPSSTTTVPTGQQILKNRAEQVAHMQANLQAKQAARPASQPAPAAPVVNVQTSQAHEQVAAEVKALQDQLTRLYESASLTDLMAAVDTLGVNLVKAVDLLEGARKKGFYYFKELDEKVIQGLDRWPGLEKELRSDLDNQSRLLSARLLGLNNQVTQLNAVLSSPQLATAMLRTTQGQVNNLLQETNRVREMISKKYYDLNRNINEANARLSTIHWMLAQVAEAKFAFQSGEEIVLAAPARWDQVGDNDPEGILYLTNRRVIFEQKEKVAKKKILFLAVEKELVHQVLIDKALSEIQSVNSSKRGVFNNQDFITLKFSSVSEPMPFHLDGQRAEEWAGWIEKARQGKLAQERSTRSVLGYADLTGEITQADIMAIQGEVNQVQDELMLRSARQQLEALGTELRTLQNKLAKNRSRGYAIEKGLEQEIALLLAQWERVKTNADLTIQQQTTLLSEQSRIIQAKMAQLAGVSGNLAAARPVYLEVKSALASAQAQADAAEDTILAQYVDFQVEVEGLSAHLEWISWMLDALATASFQLLATESGVAAVEAFWEFPGREPENGILFLTDQRLLWEDRVGDYELKVNLPVQKIREAKKEQLEGSDEEVLTITMEPGSPLGGAQFRLAAPVADAWLKMISRARNGDYHKDRAVEIDEEELNRIKNAPTQCQRCSAVFSAPVLRGQREIVCEYCGAVHRL